MQSRTREKIEHSAIQHLQPFMLQKNLSSFLSIQNPLIQTQLSLIIFLDWMWAISDLQIELVATLESTWRAMNNKPFKHITHCILCLLNRKNWFLPESPWTLLNFYAVVSISKGRVSLFYSIFYTVCVERQILRN